MSVAAAAILLSGYLLSQVGPTNAQLEAKLFHDTNAYRVDHGRAPLAYDGTLTLVARIRSTDMRVNYLPVPEYLKHINSDGTPFYRVAEHYAPDAAGVGENICRAFHSDKWQALNKAIEALQNSPPHKKAWLSPSHGYLGVGASTGRTGPYVDSLLITQTFAADVAPAQSSPVEVSTSLKYRGNHQP